jgi:hypothetical protein
MEGNRNRTLKKHGGTEGPLNSQHGSVGWMDEFSHHNKDAQNAERPHPVRLVLAFFLVPNHISAVLSLALKDTPLHFLVSLS